MKAKIIKGFMATLFVLFLTGCVEHRYYHEHHYHREGWYNHHHRQPPPGVRFDIHN